MLSVAVSYRPEGGECVPVQTEASRKIKEETGSDRFVVWRREGEWVVSFSLGEGEFIDVAGLGEGERPVLRPGMIPSIKSMWEAARSGRGPLAKMSLDGAKQARKWLAERRYEQNRRAEEFQYMMNESRRRTRRKVHGLTKEHPLLNPPR